MGLHHDIEKTQKRISGKLDLGRRAEENQLFLENCFPNSETKNYRICEKMKVFISGEFLGMKLGSCCAEGSKRKVVLCARKISKGDILGK